MSGSQRETDQGRCFAYEAEGHEAKNPKAKISE